MLEQDSSALFARQQAPGVAPVSGSELAQGLLLMRASAMKVVRLQLAMERHDRALALRTMDDLVALDSTIRDFLSEMPGGGAEIEDVQRELDAERAALNREKFSLTAGLVRRGTPQDQRSRVAADASPPPQPSPKPVIEPVACENAFEQAFAAMEVEHRPRTWIWVLLTLLIVSAAAVAAAFYLQPELLGQAIGIAEQLTGRPLFEGELS
jgi:hypothetical protein